MKMKKLKENAKYLIKELKLKRLNGPISF